MTQKLIILERDSKEELKKAIKKHLEDATAFRMVSLSVIKQLSHFEAWILVEDHYAIAGFE